MIVIFHIKGKYFIENKFSISLLNINYVQKFEFNQFNTISQIFIQYKIKININVIYFFIFVHWKKNLKKLKKKNTLKFDYITYFIFLKFSFKLLKKINFSIKSCLLFYEILSIEKINKNFQYYNYA